MTKSNNEVMQTLNFSGRLVKRFKTTLSGVSKTQQQYKDECDINWIVAHNPSDDVNLIIEKNAKAASYGSVNDYETVLEHLDKVAQTRSYFEDLPSHIRSQFGNDFKTFLIESQDKNCFDKFVKAGIYEGLKPKEEIIETVPSTDLPTDSLDKVIDKIENV